jgi:hypothetical protein
MGEGKKPPPWVEYRVTCEDSSDPRYKTFDLFQGDENVKIYFESPKEGARVTQMKPSVVGINWEQVKTGLRRIALAMYKDTMTVKFSDVGG